MKKQNKNAKYNEPEKHGAVCTHAYISFFKKNKKIILPISIVLLILVIVISQIIVTNTVNINGKNAQRFGFETIGKFQLNRWNEIKKEVFGENAVSTNILDTKIAGMSIKSGNQYFNWTDTSNLGITPWNGTTTNSSGEQISWSNFTNGADSPTALRYEENKFTDSYIDGQSSANVTAENTINYYVIDVSTAEELRWVLSTIAADKNSSNSYKINLLNDIDLNGNNNIIWSSIELDTKGTLYIEGNGHTIYNFRNSYSNNLGQTGFFSQVKSSLIVKNLSFKSVFIVSNRDNIGTLVGVLNDSTSNTGLFVENVNVSDGLVMSSASNVGGLLRKNKWNY